MEQGELPIGKEKAPLGGSWRPLGRLRGACCLYAFLANPSPASLRDATSPQGEAFPLHSAQFKTCKAMDCVVY